MERRLPIFVAALGSVLVVLLITSNVLLWQIADDDSGENEKASNPAQQSSVLPPRPQGGTSNRAQAEELDKLARALQTQFAGLEEDLAPLANLGSVADSLPSALGGLTFDLSGFGLQGLNADLGRLDSLASLDDIADSTGRLRKLQTELARIRTNIAAVDKNTAALNDSGDQTLEQLTTSNAGIAQTNTGIASTNTQLADMLTRIGQTNTQLGDLGQTMGSVDTTTKDVKANTATMSQSMSALRGDVQELNQNLLALIALSCQTPSPPAGCP